MNQFRSFPLKKLFPDTRNISGRQPPRIPLARNSSPLATIRPFPFPPNSTFSAFPTCQRHLSECTIMYRVGLGDYSSVYKWDSNPKSLAPGTLACGLVQLGLMRRRRLPLFQLSPLPPHQPLIRWAHPEFGYNSIRMKYYECYKPSLGIDLSTRRSRFH